MLDKLLFLHRFSTGQKNISICLAYQWRRNSCFGQIVHPTPTPQNVKYSTPPHPQNIKSSTPKTSNGPPQNCLCKSGKTWKSTGLFIFKNYECEQTMSTRFACRMLYSHIENRRKGKLPIFCLAVPAKAQIKNNSYLVSPKRSQNVNHV